MFVPVEFVPQPVPLPEIWAMAAAIPARIRRGHPGRLLARALILAGLCPAVLALFPMIPSWAAAAVAGMLLVVYGREDLASPPAR